jgi:Ku protein
LSFGLVTIPVRFYTATSSQSPHFHLIHEQCGSRIKQQLFSPTCGRVVERNELVRGYEVQGHSEHGGQYVLFADEELRALETAASPALDITEFVPLAKIDSTYFEGTYYLGLDKGGEQVYRLLVKTMADTLIAAVVQLARRAKENVAAVRVQNGAMVLHTRFFADEVYRLRYRLAWDHTLCRAVVGVYARALLASTRASHAPTGSRTARPGRSPRSNASGPASNSTSSAASETPESRRSHRRLRAELRTATTLAA